MTTLYEKRGRRYVPVAEDTRWESWPSGFHLVYCKPGSRACRFSIDPETAGLRAAAEAKRQRLQEIIKALHQGRPAERKPLTNKQRAAYDAFAATMGNGLYLIEYASIADMADQIIEELLK